MTRVASTEQVASGASPVRRFAAHIDLVASRRSAYTRLLYPCTNRNIRGVLGFLFTRMYGRIGRRGQQPLLQLQYSDSHPWNFSHKLKRALEYLKHSARHEPRVSSYTMTQCHLWSSRQMHARMRRPRRPQHACCMIHHQRMNGRRRCHCLGWSRSKWSPNAGFRDSDDPPAPRVAQGTGMVRVRRERLKLEWHCQQIAGR